MTIMRLFILIVILLGACVPVRDDTEPARQALVEFFDFLNQGRYDDAVELYGGDYEVLTDHNSSLDPSDNVALWKNACTINGAQCLPVRTATLEKNVGDEYLFIVEFSNPDGTLFVLGPCCDGSETDFPPVSQFEYRVQKTTDGRLVVLDLPIYVP
ncbi:MAG: hypothetical protein Q8L41_02045 [Anaerolineales bacterium]|nr:hypothetical protein [Anaerolineales bacterium]